MSKEEDFEKSAKAFGELENKTSWFIDAPYRWASASLPLAYAFACVEVVAKNSEAARPIYQRIVKDLGSPSFKVASEGIISEVPRAELERVKNVLVHSESELLSDPNKPFRALEGMLSSLEMVEGSVTLSAVSGEEKREVEELEEVSRLVIEFMNVGFNRESDVKRGVYRVIPSSWLILAVAVMSWLESQNVNLEQLNRAYNVRKYKGQTIDFNKVLAQNRTSKWHRLMVSGSKLKQHRTRSCTVTIKGRLRKRAYRAKC